APLPPLAGRKAKVCAPEERSLTACIRSSCRAKTSFSSPLASGRGTTSRMPARMTLSRNSGLRSGVSRIIDVVGRLRIVASSRPMSASARLSTCAMAMSGRTFSSSPAIALTSPVTVEICSAAAEGGRSAVSRCRSALQLASKAILTLMGTKTPAPCLLSQLLAHATSTSSALTHIDRGAEDGERRGRFLEAVLVASGGLASRLAIERGRLAEVTGGGVRVERLRATQLAHRFAELLIEHRSEERRVGRGGRRGTSTEP